MKVGGFTNAPIPWPRIKKTGRASLVLCGDLLDAVMSELLRNGLPVAPNTHWNGGAGITTFSGTILGSQYWSRLQRLFLQGNRSKQQHLSVSVSTCTC